jgi:hypothetical protein
LNNELSFSGCGFVTGTISTFSKAAARYFGYSLAGCSGLRLSLDTLSSVTGFGSSWVRVWDWATGSLRGLVISSSTWLSGF